MRRRALTLRCLAAAFAFALPAFADGEGAAPSASARSAADALFFDGRALVQQGRYAEGCAKLEESLRLAPGIGTAYNLADCRERIGQTATAWAAFLAVASQAQSQKQPARASLARRRAQLLAPKLGRLVVAVPAPAPGIEVRRDGALLSLEAWGAAVPVDPGAHTVTATAPGRERFDAAIVTEGGATARITVGPLAPEALDLATATATATTTTTTSNDALVTFSEPDASPSPSARPRVGRVIGVAAGGAGIAALAVGAGFGLASLSSRDAARPHCQGNACDAAGVGFRQDAIREGNVATVVTIAGGALLVAGVVLTVTSPRAERLARSRAVAVVPSATPTGGGLSLTGAWP